MRVGTKEFMQGLKALCDKHGLLLRSMNPMRHGPAPEKMFAYDGRREARCDGDCQAWAAFLLSVPASSLKKRGRHDGRYAWLDFGGNPLGWPWQRRNGPREKPIFCRTSQARPVFLGQAEDVMKAIRACSTNIAPGADAGFALPNADDQAKLIGALRKKRFLC